MRLDRRLPVFLLLSLFGLPLSAYGQTFRFGGVVAGEVTDVLALPDSPYVDSSNRISFGPMAEVRLPLHLSVEVNALYRSSLNHTDGPYSFGFNSGFQIYSTDVKAHSWEFPVLGEWRGPKRLGNFFVGGGVSFRTVAGTVRKYGSFRNYFTNVTSTNDDQFSLSRYPDRRMYGRVIVAGIDIRTGVLHLRPQVRYTRWNTSSYPLWTSVSTIQVLTGITVGK